MMGLAIKCMASEPVPVEGLVRTLRALGLDGSSAGRVRERSQIRLRRLIVRGSTAVAALVSAAYLWLWWIDIDPNVRVPNPTMPSPNAFTYFRAAGLALQQKEDVDYAHSRPGSPGPDGKPRTYTLADKERLVAANAEALRLLRAGFRYEYLEPPARSFSHVYPHYAQDRALARLLALEAAVHEAKGNLRQAADSALDAVDLGVRIPRGGNIIGMLVGIACEAIGRAELWSRVDKLSGPDAAAASRRLVAIEPRRFGVASALIDEKWAAVAGLQELMRARGWRWNAGSLSEGGRSWRIYLALLPHSKRAIIGTYISNMDAQISASLVATKGMWLPEPQAIDPVNAILYPVFSGAVLKDATNRTQDRLLAVRLAVRAYQASRGRVPRTLEDLRSARLLETVPQDVFSAQYHKLRYTVVNGKPTLYSVGPDGVDDGGAPIRTTQEGRPNSRAPVQAGSRGDIVAGVNTW